MKKVNAFIEMVNGKELTREELSALNGQYDLFLSGSDQLWNSDIQQGDYYLQDFVVNPEKKEVMLPVWVKRNCRMRFEPIPVK